MGQQPSESICLSPNLTVAVLYEDKWLLAIDKPAGYLITRESREHTRRNLMLLLRARIDQWAYWAVKRGLRFLKDIHRLDAPATGVLLLAKTKTALAAFSRLFRQRQIEKTYHALVWGKPKAPRFDIDLPLAPQPDARGKVAVDKGHG